jgi:hypothetical protein
VLIIKRFTRYASIPIDPGRLQLGGHLEIRSAKSLGTEVTVTLPSGAEVSDVHERAMLHDIGVQVSP